MKEFDSPIEYARKYADERDLAVIPVPMAAEIFRISSAGIVARVKAGALKEVKISGVRYIAIQSVLDAISKHDRDIDIIKTYLEQQVRRGIASVEYEPVMDLLGLSTKISSDRTKIGWILGDVSRQSFHEKGVLLSVVVHRKNTDMPSENGFFGLVDDLIEGWEDKYKDKKSFVAAETKRVLKAYQK